MARRPAALLPSTVAFRHKDGPAQDCPPDDGPVVRALEEAGTPHLLLHRRQELYALVADFDDVLGSTLTYVPGTLAGASRAAAWAPARAAASQEPRVHGRPHRGVAPATALSVCAGYALAVLGAAAGSSVA
ncbi:hypothetical protein [Streptomyces sp. ISL-100]|uniref:hypothetical protein n=1 Tax=Streptomyces sp. ISL-100 TaxID=2819173 RepID=UPI001BE85936|nr:hypothetical protein [Streptomyces sp. ISL-100]MBT2396696.1 hypothetical protein [Streptomyces sp. ISL-100]